MYIPIKSQRLDLVSMTPAFLHASLNNNLQEAQRELNLTLPIDWPGENARLLTLRLKQLDDEPDLQPWLVRAMVLRASGAMVGCIGFHTAPGPDYLAPYSTGAVEFGFRVFPPFRRQGYAREASLALMDWAHQNHGIDRFVLTISPDNLASQALAGGLGFKRIGSHIDEIDGPEDMLELITTVRIIK
jgi:RimJ/RimL family protein N-acetyltransferase